MIAKFLSAQTGLALIVLFCLSKPLQLEAQKPSGVFVFSWFDDVYTMRIGDAEPTRITFDAETREAIWSPDGSQIAYVAYLDDNREIFVMNADGSQETRLTENDTTDSQITWSPDGSRIAFTSDRNGNREVYTMNPDGSDQVNISNNPGWDEHPAWSVDGRYLAFVSDVGSSDWEIYITDIDGGHRTRLTKSDFTDKLPVWSPDGSQIAFVRADETTCEQIYVIEIESREETRVGEPICDLGQLFWRSDNGLLWYMNNAVVWQINTDGSSEELFILPTYGAYPTGFDYWIPDLYE